MLLSTLPVLSDANLGDQQEKDLVLVQSSSSSNIGVTIPVIVRQGSTDTSVIPEKTVIKFNDSGVGGRIDLQLGLRGNRSAYGDIEITQKIGGKEKTIAVLKSFALYFPYPREQVSISLRPDVNRQSFNSNSKLRVRFKNKSVDSNKKYWLDETVTPIIE